MIPPIADLLQLANIEEIPIPDVLEGVALPFLDHEDIIGKKVAPQELRSTDDCAIPHSDNLNLLTPNEKHHSIFTDESSIVHIVLSETVVSFRTTCTDEFWYMPCGKSDRKKCQISS